MKHVTCAVLCAALSSYVIICLILAFFVPVNALPILSILPVVIFACHGLTFGIVGASAIILIDIAILVFYSGAGAISDPGFLLGHSALFGIAILVGYLRNIQRDLVLSKEQLTAATKGSRAILDTVSDGVVVIDQDGNILSVNPSVVGILGYSADELVGRNISAILSGTFRREQLGRSEGYNVTPGGTPVIDNFRFSEAKCKDGTVFPIELSVDKMATPAGTTYVGVMRDLSSRRRLEEELQRTRRMAVVGELAAGIAHDFNNMLAIIMVNTDSLAGATPREQERIRDEIRRACTNASGLVKQLLAFGGKQTLFPRALDPSMLVRDVSKLIASALNDRIKIEMDFEPEPWQIVVDKHQMEQVLINLAFNARDAMPEGGLLRFSLENTRVKLSLARILDVDPGDYVCLSVEDTGCGIPEEIRKKIFDPFFTTKNSGSKKGTGMGLAVVHGIVRQSGGGIRVESKVGLGTSFQIYLPKDEGNEAVEQMTITDSGRYILSTVKVLLVDDDALVRNALKRPLEKQGFKVILASSGKEALEIFRKEGQSVSLLITDVAMAGLDGFQIADEMRKISPELKAIFITGNSVFPDGGLGPNDGFISKPFSTDQLTKEVMRLLGADTVL